MPNVPVMSLRNISVTYGARDSQFVALRDLSLDLYKGELLAVIGPSGCGKTTLLRVMAGLESPSGGSVVRWTDGETGRPSPAQGDGRGRGARVGIVFQEATLLPWENVKGNIGLPLKLRGVDKRTLQDRVESLVKLLNLQGFERNLPGELSGGMAQRVAIGRALAMDAEVLLLDEPFAALDALLRDQMGEEFDRLWLEFNLTGCLVTHSIHEAVMLGSRVAVMSKSIRGIREIIDVPLPRPRTAEGEFAADLLALERRCRELLAGDV